jgi:Lrp/AsnC family leucine-responsive transcriptional regulator
MLATHNEEHRILRQKQLDFLDYKIIDLLCKDARTPLTDIARKTRVSVPTVAERIQRLVEKGIIEAFRPKLDYNQLGYDLLGISLVNTKYGRDYARQVGAKLSRIPGVEEVHFVLGDLDFIVISRARDRQDLTRIVNSFISMKEIEKTSTHIVLTTLKESKTIPPCPKEHTKRVRTA